jgi:hypothetical protein
VTYDRVVPFDQTTTVVHRLGKTYKICSLAVETGDIVLGHAFSSKGAIG